MEPLKTPVSWSTPWLWFYFYYPRLRTNLRPWHRLRQCASQSCPPKSYSLTTISLPAYLLVFLLFNNCSLTLVRSLFPWALLLFPSLPFCPSMQESMIHHTLKLWPQSPFTAPSSLGVRVGPTTDTKSTDVQVSHVADVVLTYNLCIPSHVL